ncbi:hypothetical protein GGF32_007733 [Allomyces javanicus]|nr:hypothetical protein GGF32_007733 [Allomyces javanicus]
MARSNAAHRANGGSSSTTTPNGLPDPSAASSSTMTNATARGRRTTTNTAAKSTNAGTHVRPALFSPAGLALLAVQTFFALATPIFGLAILVASKGGNVIKSLTAHPTVGPLINPALDLLADFVTYHRGIFATVFVAPASVAWDAVEALRDWMYDLQMPPVGDVSVRREIHAARVVQVQRQIRELVAGGATRLCTARPGFLAMSMKAGTYKKHWGGVDVHALRDIVEIDTVRQIVRVEPGCNMGRLSRELIKKGWTLEVLPELDDLTVGGLINGFGIETSSHKYGLFQHTCTAFEVVLPSGDVVFCDKDNNADLFATIPWSHGTIGFLTAADIKIVRAKPWVKMEYRPCRTQAECVRVFEEASRDNGNDFVEELMYTKDTGVVMVGKMVDAVPRGGTVNVLSRWYKPWFFTHVASFLNRPAGTPNAVEYLPLRDYYHRHTRSIFWEIQDIVPFGNTWWYRYLVAWVGTPKISILKMTTTGKLKVLWETMHVAQDLLVPISTLKESLDLFHDELTVYPLWLCPMRMLSPPENLLAERGERPAVAVLDRTHPQHAPQGVTTPAGSLTPPHPAEQLYVDVGAYGVPKSPKFHFERSLEVVEEFVRKVQGYQALYADTMLTRAQFREMFDHRLYDKVRDRFQVGSLLPEIWDKVNKGARA